MAQNHLVQVRVNKEVRDVAAEILAKSGITVSDIIRLLFKRIAEDKIIPKGLFKQNKETLDAVNETDLQTITIEEIRAIIRENN